MGGGRRRAPLFRLFGVVVLAAIVVVGWANDEAEDERSAPRGPALGIAQVVERLCVAAGERRQGREAAASRGPGGRARAASELATGVRRLGLLNDRWAEEVAGLVDGLTAYEQANRLAQAGDVLADPLPVARQMVSSRRALDAAAARLGAPSCAASSLANEGLR